MMIKVTNHVKMYEENGKEIATGEARHIKVKSHRNRRTMIVIEIGEDMSVTVSADDMLRSIANAKNAK